MSSTVQIQHKDITNPTVTHADKFMNVIVTCINRVCNLGNGKNESNICDLNQLLEATNRIVERNKDKATEEAIEPSSTNLTETFECNEDKATEEATNKSSANPDESSPHTNPFQWVTRSMQHI